MEGRRISLLPRVEVVDRSMEDVFLLAADTLIQYPDRVSISYRENVADESFRPVDGTSDNAHFISLPALIRRIAGYTRDEISVGIALNLLNEAAVDMVGIFNMDYAAIWRILAVKGPEEVVGVLRAAGARATMVEELNFGPAMPELPPAARVRFTNPGIYATPENLGWLEQDRWAREEDDDE